MKADENSLSLALTDDKETIKSTLDRLDVDHYKTSIFIHHSPMGIEYITEKGADLVLSGHTHAGQVFQGTLLSPFSLNLITV
ncbi:hypothetical protein ACIPUP_02710 [Pectobacterium actinidiae]|uniref:Calcineurin-like phosphoesterase domain-containing protein n=1 Tax=Pectobacterium actinidiae TaxID=1507808 RepID=A0ABW8G653_9GAMM